ncbi:MAG: hypothetical protein QXF45_06930 [Candidatus Caldarchaeum sp.]
MNTRAVLGAIVGLGVIVQIFLGESGLAAGALRDVHATIGLLGLVIAAGYLAVNRNNKRLAAITAAILAITVAQAVMGMGLYGWIRFDIPYRILSESHRGIAYILFLLGVVASIIAVRARRAASMPK